MKKIIVSIFLTIFILSSCGKSKIEKPQDLANLVIESLKDKDYKSISSLVISESEIKNYFITEFDDRFEELKKYAKKKEELKNVSDKKITEAKTKAKKLLKILVKDINKKVAYKKEKIEKSFNSVLEEAKEESFNFRDIKIDEIEYKEKSNKEWEKIVDLKELYTLSVQQIVMNFKLKGEKCKIKFKIINYGLGWKICDKIKLYI